MEAYLDNSATTRACQAAADAVAQSMRSAFYNPSALYGRAVEAERALQAARRTVAAPVGAREENVVFTSGGTESDNLAIFGTLGTLRGTGRVLYSAAEHPAEMKTPAGRPRSASASRRRRYRLRPADRSTWMVYGRCLVPTSG
jgi:cysteine desulfurase